MMNSLISLIQPFSDSFWIFGWSRSELPTMRSWRTVDVMEKFLNFEADLLERLVKRWVLTRRTWTYGWFKAADTWKRWC